MADRTDTPQPLSLEDMQRWTWVIGRAQQLMLEHGVEMAMKATETPAPPAFPTLMETTALSQAATDFWSDSLKLWQRFLMPAEPSAPSKDKRFAAPEWQQHPVFDLIRQTYLTIADHMLKSVDLVEGVDPVQKEKLRFATRAIVDAMSPSNFVLTNPEVMKRTLETGGENLLRGLEHLLRDLRQGQLTHVKEGAFELGRNLATTPGKVVKRAPLYELIQYSPTTDQVFETPLVIFPPWINRFYILDLTPEKSFIRWAVEQGLTVFMVSWKSADAAMKDVIWDDYVAAQIDAIDTIRDLLDVKAVHAIGYCVAGTTLAATLAVLAGRGEAEKVRSATFFTAQVDFEQAGELKNFVDDEQLKMLEGLAPEGFFDGRYMAATFNLLRGRDLIWNYVVSNYLLGNDYPAFDLLHWNGDTTNLPAKWHRAYLSDLYRDNKLVVPKAMTVLGVPLDLREVTTPTYVQAGREDHIAPAESVWKITDHFDGPVRFVLAGSGHIAGVVNPPAAGKYQYWTNAKPAASLDEFVAGATEIKGSWWPDWIDWLSARAPEKVPAEGARLPGEGKLAALEDAPGSYVRSR
ncbi:putative poly(R)-hydroxyalkanoic acid synthase [Sphingomonas changbaiensis NBRC 104936]|uniref:Putative poly(R)-hydroxyalkanoic acid synthase n=1 Tax=Sphingomonas changbaiensis NBRC 104936 TaxID=1219043 RepID=A0A0E9MQM7_9SPHN|nr:class I poly(R)-hydroxyalkanoic acid synthase [Sphingomonas changbaiensis]GAO39798.1 putative poly(R)-hydroxyalkanoic acid synthase [Sphingomonas changbaiensis NBRC 104936]